LIGKFTDLSKVLETVIELAVLALKPAANFVHFAWLAGFCLGTYIDFVEVTMAII